MGTVGMPVLRPLAELACGFDLRSAREKVRVGRALDDLPLICEAFSRGELSYSKVRAVTRIATSETEADLLMLARHGTTQHIEKIVRGYRRRLPSDEDGIRHERRYVRHDYTDDGSVLIKARLDPEEAALVLKALDKIVDEVRATRRAAEPREDGSAEPLHDRADALVEIARRQLAGEKCGTSSADRYTVMVHVDAEVVSGADGECHLEDGSALSAETVKRLSCDGSLVAVVEGEQGEILSVGRKTRTIPTAIRRALHARDGGCRFPGCTHKAFIDGHHVKHWCEGGETALSNLVSLCSFHHRQLHQGNVTVHAEPDGRFTFLTNNGRVIETAVFSVDAGGVESANRALGLEIDTTTAVPNWDGGACDYSVAIEGLLERDGHGSCPHTGGGSAEPLRPTSPDYDGNVTRVG
jgi:DNA-binding MarR family transcriptional regulator